MIEQWKWVAGYVGYYEVSDLGRVRSVDRVVKHHREGPKRLKGRILKVTPFNRYGHLETCLWKNGARQKVSVHRLVALTWIGPCPNGQQVRHGPKGKMDNSVGNLSYGTPSENSLDMRRDGTHTGKAVRRSDGVEFVNMYAAAEESNCDHRAVWAVCKGRRKTAGGYGWEYK